MEHPPASKRRTTTLLALWMGKILGLALVANLSCLAGFVVLARVQEPLPDQVPAAAEVPAKPTKAEVLVKRHECWTSEAPADMVGQIPGHVVTDRGYGGIRMVGKALEQTFGDVDHGLVIYGFCR